jgi:Beta-galactosidase
MALPGVRLGIVRSISYGLFGKPDQFLPQLRELGAGLVRVYFYWSQVEPEPGRYNFDAVDAFLDQLDGSEEVWVTLCSSSRWATRQATEFLPPSPAKDPEDYRRFVDRLVRHCGGRVRYWQCDNEPSNVGLLWAGTAADYVAQLEVMHRAVKAADPEAAVVLGGAPFGLPESPPDSPDRQFFDVLLRDGRDHFDLFDLHLYGEATRIPADVETARGLMRAHGYEKPLVAGEYNAPWPNLAGLYERMDSLPPQLQMFMRGCPRELEDKRHRINCREIVMRNLLALASGVRRTVCWNLAPDIPGYENHLSVMDLLFGKLALLDYEGSELSHRHPAAGTFALLAGEPGHGRRRVRAAPPGRGRRRPRAAAGVHHPAARQRRLTASPAGCRILGAWIFR